MNILGRHSRHQLTVLACCLALSFLAIFEATCSLMELIKNNLTFQGTPKGRFTSHSTRPTTSELRRKQKFMESLSLAKHNTEPKGLKPRWPRYPLRCTAANHGKYFLCKLPRCSLFEFCRETRRFCWKSWKTTSWPQAHGSSEREGNVTCHLRHVSSRARPRDTNIQNRVYAAFHFYAF